ncbi:PREDICTED: nucleolar protein 56-like isoform X2 [Camelina sativa]|uniref:Nucleolar protein 56-like isoform X2 n=1 Tax=Camelina sativa TaxID=90675 RepID=A0ABM1RCA2_CAMSA|nr:PREDICTED: nucleolar protein 56-like isoform X2 [Camelina sativa]
MAMYVQYKSSSGYAIFEVHGLDEIGQNTEAVRTSVSDLSRFGRVVQLTAFPPFESALDALNQINAVSEGVMTDELRSLLELNLPKVKEGKKPKFSLGLAEPKLGSHIFEATKIPCQSNEFVLELLRGVRQHFDRFIKDLKIPFWVSRYIAGGVGVSFPTEQLFRSLVVTLLIPLIIGKVWFM